jgi:hypothetical protein
MLKFELLIHTLFLTIFTMSWSMSLSATCIWTMSPQFLIIVSSNWDKQTSALIISRVKDCLNIPTVLEHLKCRSLQHLHLSFYWNGSLECIYEENWVLGSYTYSESKKLDLGVLVHNAFLEGLQDIFCLPMWI